MKRNLGIMIAVIVVLAAFLGLVIWSIMSKSAKNINFNNYDLHSIIPGTPDNGNIADHVKGNPDAKVILFEYADFQCPGCATTNPRVNSLLEEYGDDLAIVYRHFLLSYHKNGTAAASAAEAAGLQGYFTEYSDMLFANQSKWEYASPNERGDMFTDLFREVTEGKGDLEKFRADMTSEEVKKKIDFNMAIGKKIDVPGTPAFYLDGEWIDLTNAGTESKFMEVMREKINAKLKSLK